MMSNDDDLGMGMGPEEVMPIHDQLPSVEDYKTETGYRKDSHGSLKELVRKFSSGSMRSIDAAETDPESASSPSGTGGGGAAAGQDPENSRPDPDGLDSLHLISNIPDDNDDDHHDVERTGNNDELDDEYGIESTKHSVGIRKGYGKILIAVSLISLVVIIILAVVISRNNKTSGDQHDFKLKNSQRFKATTDFLIRTGVTSDEQAFEDKNSPQYIAAQWMAHGDDAKLGIPDDQFSTKARTFVDRYALAVLYYSTGGPNWTYQMNFLSENHVCTWYQDFNVLEDEFNIFSGDYISMGVHGCKRVDDDLVPFSIFLPQNNLVGQLPEEIHVLDHMEVVTLKFNSGLTGRLPEGLSNMENLRLLQLQWCDLTGTVPTWIGSISNLEVLGLGNNRLTGNVPVEIGNLSNLQLLGLDDNDLEADIEIFHNLANLRSLYLEDNRIHGTISAALMGSWEKLQELDLSGNNLGGELPSNFFNRRSQLKVIDLHGNDFSGKFPEVGMTSMDLEFLALQDNKLTGTVPDSIVNFDKLRHLDLDNNDFTRAFNGRMGEMKALEYLFLGGNHAGTTVQFPDFVFQLTNLRELSFKGANLHNTIPDEIVLLKGLEFLDLHFNELSGTIPPEIGRLTSLQHLLLNNNNLVGTIPQDFENLTNLQVLLLEKNNLDGDADAICSSSNDKMIFFAADCQSGIQCSCCDVCCEGDDAACNAGEWDAGFDPIWEYGYRRNRYSYDMGPHTVNIPPP